MGDGPTATDWQRLGGAVKMRRLELGLPQGLTGRDCPSDLTVRKIEHGDTQGLRAKTKAQLERIFGWSPGTIDRILVGTEPDAEPDVTTAGQAATLTVETGTPNELDGVASRLALRNEAIWRSYCNMARQVDIAAQYGLSQQQVSDIIAGIRASIPEEDKDERRLRYTEQLDWITAELAVLAAAAPLPAYSNGRPILMADGVTIGEDHSHRVTAMKELRATQERASKMIGLEAKVEAGLTVDTSPEIDALLARARAQREQAG